MLQWKTATAVTTFSRGIKRFCDLFDIWGIHSSKTGNYLPKLRSVWNKLPKKSVCECRSGIFTLNSNMDHLQLQTFLILVILLARGSSWYWSLHAALFAYMLISSFLCLFGKSLFSTLCLSFPCAAVRIKMHLASLSSGLRKKISHSFFQPLHKHGPFISWCGSRKKEGGLERMFNFFFF